MKTLLIKNMIKSSSSAGEALITVNGETQTWYIQIIVCVKAAAADL